MYKTPISGEEKSAGATLSDMEIFIFPELMFSLIRARKQRTPEYAKSAAE